MDSQIRPADGQRHDRYVAVVNGIRVQLVVVAIPGDALAAGLIGAIDYGDKVVRIVVAALTGDAQAVVIAARWLGVPEWSSIPGH